MADFKEQYRLSRAGKLWILNAGDQIVGLPPEICKDDSLELHDNFLTTAKECMYQINNLDGKISLKEICVAGIVSSSNYSAVNKDTLKADPIDAVKNKDKSDTDTDSKRITPGCDKLLRRNTAASEGSGGNNSGTSSAVKLAGDEVGSHGQVSGRRRLDGLNGVAYQKGQNYHREEPLPDKDKNIASSGGSDTYAMVPIAWVKKMKAHKQGVTPVINKIEKEYMIHVEFDGKELMKLRSKDKELIEVANDTLEKDYGNVSPPENGHRCYLGNKTVDWTFYGDEGTAVDRVFSKELQELKKTKSVKVSSNKSSKQKFCVTISCSHNSFPEVKQKVESFSGCIIKPARITVVSKDSSKAEQFVKETDKEKFVCEFSDGKYLKIHGRTNKDITRGEELWKRRLDFQNALTYPSAPSFAGKGTCQPAKASVVKFVREFKDGSNKVQYLINDTLKVFIYMWAMSLTDLKDMEAVVCIVRPDLKGGRLADAIEQVGGSKYTKELDRMRINNSTLRNGQVLICKEVGKLRVKAVLHLVNEHNVPDTSPRSMRYLSDLNRAVMKEATYHKLKKLAMSLIGAGYYIKAQRDIATLCSGLASDIIDYCRDPRERQTLTELHLVNLDQGISQTLQSEFYNRSQGIDPPPRTEFGQTGSYGGDGGRRDRHHGTGAGEWDWTPTEADDWVEHKPLPDLPSKTASVKQKDSMKETKTVTSGKDLSKTMKQKCSVDSCDHAPKENLPCGHSFCTACAIPLKRNKACYVCKNESNKAQSKSLSKGASKSMSASSTGKDCRICLEPMGNPHVLPCEHELCKTCVEKLTDPKCPFCQCIFGTLRGTQPSGQMFYRKKKYNLLGYENDGTIEMVFRFKDGIQGDEHPNPGRPYKGTQRCGYLPDIEEGNKVLKLMRRAFDRRLMFTIGDSVTMGEGDRVTYNDIHLKTTPERGKFGYPDPMYLTRVQEELASKGVTE